MAKAKRLAETAQSLGGVPYWAVDKPWPNDRNGNPYKFLAQFNFADSKDIFPNLPGEVLVLLVEDYPDWIFDGEYFRFEWFRFGLSLVENFDRSLIEYPEGTFFGSIYRTSDYPDAANDDSKLETIPRFKNLVALNGTKIGGVPGVIQEHELPEGFLCQLGSIQAHPKCPFPWVNQPEPLTFGVGESKRLRLHGPFRKHELRSPVVLI